jgi:cytochrome b
LRLPGGPKGSQRQAQPESVPMTTDPKLAPTGAARPPRVLVWDLPVRVFHWLLALSFAGAWITSESERWRLLHVTLGYTLGGLIVFRVLWGLVGSRHARFADFVRGPQAVLRYLGALLRGKPEHHVGHNPAGALAIVAMLGLGALIVGSGWALYNDIGGELFEDLHEAAANAMMAVVVVHIVGVLLASRMHHENLIGAMFSGRKMADAEDGIRSAWRSVAALMLVAVLGFWSWQWQTAPSAGLASGGPEASLGVAAALAGQGRHGRDHDDDDD